MKVVCIVEGHGDAAAAPILIGRIGAAFNIGAFPSRCIRTGGWAHLQRAGELERYLELALSHQPDRILILSDLEDDCPVVEAGNFRERIAAVLGDRKVPVEVVFAMREFESWYLHSAEILSNKNTTFSWDLAKFTGDPETVRGAKEALSKIMSSRYKETTHQPRFAAAIDVKQLLKKSRSFRRMIKATTGLCYDELAQMV